MFNCVGISGAGWPMRLCMASRIFSLSVVKLTRGPGSGYATNAT
jgi:hypothetical protein